MIITHFISFWSGDLSNFLGVKMCQQIFEQPIPGHWRPLEPSGRSGTGTTSTSGSQRSLEKRGRTVGEPSWRPDKMAKFGSWYHRIIVVRSRITVNLPCYPCFIMLSWYFLLNITDACFRGHKCYWSCYVNNVLVTLTRVIADSWFNWEFLVDIDWLHKICVIHFQYCNTLNAPNETLA